MVGIQEGRILFAGEDITSAPAHTRAGRGMLRTFQNLEIPSSMSVIDTVRLGCHARFPIPMWHNLMATPRSRQVEKAIHHAAMEALDFVGLADMAHYPATTLSFGAQRAVELARALVGKPRLLLLDEPAAGLNTAETQSLAELIVRARDVFSLTVLVVEHDMDLVMSISDQVAVLCFGELMACGSPTQIQNDPRVIAAYLGGSA
jgi:branched-chain amino acid transport system ATP-binding protein